MRNITWGYLTLAITVILARPASADLFHSPKFKSPAGKYEVILASASMASLPFTRSTSQHIPPGQKAQYVLLFYAAGSSDPINADWYTDTDPAPAPEEIVSNLLWSPSETSVVITHGLHAKGTAIHRWLLSLTRPAAFGFDGDDLHWVDDGRLVGNLQNKKVPGGIILMYADKGRVDLLVSPQVGIGYILAGVTGHEVTAKQYLNHWGEEQEKTTWDAFDPACFAVDLDTMKKHSIPCPNASPKP